MIYGPNHTQMGRVGIFSNEGQDCFENRSAEQRKVVRFLQFYLHCYHSFDVTIVPQITPEPRRIFREIPDILSLIRQAFEN